MIRLIDGTKTIYEVLNNNVFDLEKWKMYANKIYEDLSNICLDDLENSISEKFTWEGSFSPIINNAASDFERIENIRNLFISITNDLENRICKMFGKSPDCDIVLYLGLCNGAGWVTKINNKTCILLGIEKIIELNWDNLNDMTGLILHEMGHVYQSAFGVLDREFKEDSDNFLWQLFTEGIAMVFEQEIIKDKEYFHQDKNGWKKWCDSNLVRISHSFRIDLYNMTYKNQTYFGDWALFEGHPDVGYYLGAKFVRNILNSFKFDDIINFNIDDVKREFEQFKPGNVTEFVFVRHGESKANRIDRELYKIFCGRFDCDLTEEGFKQAKELNFNNLLNDADVVYSSPLKRAVQTAESFAKTNIVIDERLIERTLGDFDGKPIDEIRANPKYLKYFNNPLYSDFRASFTCNAPNGESYKDVTERVSSFLKEIMNKGYKKVIIVSHVGAIRCMLMVLKGLSKEETLQIRVKHCEPISVKF